MDTEFIEAGPTKPIQLISIGIVSQDGRGYYAQSSEYNVSDASEWVKENVIAKLADIAPKRRHVIAIEILKFVWPGWPERGDKPEFWGYYADYDWVVFAQLFGTMMDLPKGFPMYCNDIKQLGKSLGDPELPKQGKSEHNALADAKWNMVAYEFLLNRENRLR